ncbi:Hypothetical predicted protein [Mytilus galloprovincialis]|uniref:STING ligand-binding domain-containing protein n=1 Tax=Mytilus galloprovincialis TaxID=29158 RepID=A0A8B6BI62_MYTGA|nr:Hypothetical predicted protein [Mytilus galloprovincialis]
MGMRADSEIILLNPCTEERKQIPKKLYELIPRKCYVDIPGSDENIEKVSDLAIEGDRAGNKRKIKLQIYSIKDGKKKYYCVCECPPVLNTINNMNDIQTAGITRSTGSNIFFPLRRHPKLQLFTVDTKLVQLMRFYYAMNALLCLKKENKEKARFLLFNGQPSTFQPCTSKFDIRENYTDPVTKDLQSPLFEKTRDDDKPGQSYEDNMFMKQLDNEFVIDSEGSWVAPLPFRVPRQPLPSNRQQESLLICYQSE